MPFAFHLYGIPLFSDTSIPGLISISAPADSPAAPLRIWLAETPSSLDSPWLDAQPPWYTSPSHTEQGIPTLEVWKLASGAFFRFRYADGTQFLVRSDGNEVAAKWPARMTLADVATYLVGPIVGFVLRLRGVTCLHASAIALDGQAIVLVGAPGAGKSTTAAVLAQRGVPVLSDDVSALDWRDGRPWVHPGYPRVNLWPEAVRATFGQAGALPLITPDWEKRYLDLTQPPYRFASEALPLAAVFLLTPDPAHAGVPQVSPVVPQQAVMSLIANTYVNYLIEAAQRAAEFTAVGRVVSSIPVRRLTYRPDAASFAAVPETVLAEFPSISASRPA